jgi:hypothetical protein
MFMKSKKLKQSILSVRSVIVVFFLGSAEKLFSQTLIPSGLQSMAEQVFDVFTGDMARIILGCCFAGSCIAYAYNKDNEKMKAKILAVMVATGLLVLTSEVIDQLWSLT